MPFGEERFQRFLICSFLAGLPGLRALATNLALKFQRSDFVAELVQGVDSRAAQRSFLVAANLEIAA